MFDLVKVFFAKSCAVIFCTLSFSAIANAQTAFGSLEADAGTYEPIVIGGDVNISACGSIFNSTQGNFNLCDAPTVSFVNFTWTITKGFGSFENMVLTGSDQSFTSGGVADFFAEVGTYFLNLDIDVTSNPFPLPGGFTGLIPSASTADSDFSLQGIQIVNPTTVPEPEALLLLFPAMVYIARRQRRRKMPSAC